MKYRIEYKATDIEGCDIIECTRIVEANSLPQALHEVIEMSPVFHQKIIEITNYYWLGD